jgi:hypothetical protein
MSGYKASVNGKSAQAIRSNKGLAEILVPTGTSKIELDYEGTPLLRASYWLALCGWIAALLMGIAGALKPRNLSAPVQ